MSVVHVHPVQIYYEDTDHSGVVYHPNYLKYFERAREHLLGVPELVRMLDEEGIGFVVYHVELTFKEGAVFGDGLHILTRVVLESAYRVAFHQNVVRPPSDAVLVQGVVQLVCVNREKKLVPLPQNVLDRLNAG